MAHARRKSSAKGPTSVLPASAAVRSGSRARQASPDATDPLAARYSRSAAWLGAWLIAVAVLLAYANSLGNPLILDDRVSIVENEDIHDLSTLGSALWASRGSPVAGRPVASLTLALNYAVAGVEPAFYRATNLAIHLACAWLLLGALGRTLAVSRMVAPPKGQAFAVAVALLWAVHPLTSETVDYITQRTESLMALWLLATLYASARAHQSRDARPWLAASLVTCALGMASKESMVVAPVLVVLCDGWLVYPSVKAAFRARWGYYSLLAATWGVLAALNWHGPRARSAGFSSAADSWTYLLNQAPLILGYLRRAVWPNDLVVLYGAPQAMSVSDVWLPGAFLLVLAVGAGLALHRRSAWGVVGAWFFITLAPASSIVPILTEVGAERRMYLPLVAVVAAAVWAVVLGWTRVCGSLGVPGTSTPLSPDAALAAPTTPWWRRASPGVVVGAGATSVVTLLLVGATVARNAEYATPLGLAQTVLDRRPSGYASHMMAEALIAEGRSDEAIPFLEEAIAGRSPRARYVLGVLYFNRGDYADAYAELEAFVTEDPLLFEVVQSRIIMGRVLALEARWPEAIAQFREVLRMRPSETEARHLLAQALVSHEDFEEAVGEYRAYLEVVPDDLDARCDLGIALVGSGQADEAMAVFRRNLERDATHVASQVNLALVLFDARRPDEALPHAEQAAALQPENAERHDFLGRVLAVLGRFEEARQAFERALEIDPSYAPARDNLMRLEQLAHSVGVLR